MCVFVVVEWILLRASVVYRLISSIFYGFRDKHYRKRPSCANFQNLKVFIFHPMLMQFFYEVFILMGYWGTIKQICYLNSKRCLKGNHIPKFRIFERYARVVNFFHPLLMWCFVVEWIVFGAAFGSMSAGFHYQPPLFLNWSPTLMGYNWTLHPI